MFSTISRYTQTGFYLLEKGLAHSSFLGRAVSWGIFYGALYLVVLKVIQVVSPLLQKKNKPSLAPLSIPLKVEISGGSKTPTKEENKGGASTPVVEQGLEKEISQPGFEEVSPPSPKNQVEGQKKIWGWWWPFK